MGSKRTRKIIRTRDELVTIEGLSSRGHGVAHASDGKVVFVPGAVPDEQCRVKRLVTKGSFDNAELLEVCQSGPSRVEPPCPHYSECGGCQLQHIAYEEQLKFKQDTVANALRRIGKMENPDVLPTVPAPPFGYRNKFSLALERTGKGCKIGMRKQGSLEIASLNDCLIVTDRVRHAIIDLTQEHQQLSKWFSHIRIREIDESLIIVFEPKVTNVQPEASRAAIKAGKEIEAKACFLHFESKHPAHVEQNLTRLYGDSCFPAGPPGRRTYCGPLSFLQVNNAVAEELFATVRDYPWGRTQLAVDAYCGVGVLTFMLAQRFEKVIGLEIDKTAVERANRSAREQNLSNLRFFDEPLPEGLTIDKFDGKVPDLIVLDPPRTGLDPCTLSRILSSGARHLAMISCHPATLARDLAQMDEYRPLLIQPFDMFPQTFHVESLVILQKQ